MKNIPDLAHRLTRRYGTSSPFELCDCLGIRVQRPELPEATQALYFRTPEGHSIILLNSVLAEPESRYCCAHELGHILLHPGMNAQIISDLTGGPVRRLPADRPGPRRMGPQLRSAVPKADRLPFRPAGTRREPALLPRQQKMTCRRCGNVLKLACYAGEE